MIRKQKAESTHSLPCFLQIVGPHDLLAHGGNLRKDIRHGGAKAIEQEIRARWAIYCKDKHGRPRRLPDYEIYGYYVVRGKNRALAEKKGMPMSYHKLALLATSVFKLSHWRNDVTVASYLLV